MLDRWDKPGTDNVKDSDNGHVNPKRKICGVSGVEDQQSNKDKEEAASSLRL